MHMDRVTSDVVAVVVSLAERRAGHQARSSQQHGNATRFPFAGELQGALADWLRDRLIGGDAGEPFALRFASVSQPVDQTLAEQKGLQRRRMPTSFSFLVSDDQD